MEPPGLSTASRNSSMSSDTSKKTKHAMGPTLNSLRGTQMDGTSVQMDSQRRGLQTRAANQYNSNSLLQMVLIAPFMKMMHRLWTRQDLNWQCGNMIIVFYFWLYIVFQFCTISRMWYIVPYSLLLSNSCPARELHMWTGLISRPLYMWPGCNDRCGYLCTETMQVVASFSMTAGVSCN